MRLALLASVGLLSGCVGSSSLFEGPAMWAIVLGARSGPGLPPVQLGTAAVVVATVEGGSDLIEDTWIDDANVEIDTGNGPVPADLVGDGLYFPTTPLDEKLFAASGTELSVTAAFGGQVHSVHQVAIDPAVSPSLMVHTVGEELVVELPDDLGDLHTGVVSQILTTDGVELWNDFPKKSKGWLELASDDRVPKRVRVPGSVFDGSEDTVAIAIYALRQDDERFERSEDLNSHVSGFFTGSALLAPILVFP